MMRSPSGTHAELVARYARGLRHRRINPFTIAGRLIAENRTHGTRPDRQHQAHK